MPKVKIESEIKPDLLYYNWEISRKFRITSQAETEDHKYNTQKLLTVSNQVLDTDYYTKDHPLNLSGNLSQNTLFVSKLSVYLKGQEEHAETFIGIYTLAELQSGKIHNGENGFEVPCFKSSTGSTEKQNNHTVVCEIPQQEKRAFFCTSILTEEAYKKGERAYNDPFDKERIEQDILLRVDEKIRENKLKEDEELRKHFFPYPSQMSASLCGPATFYYCLLKDRPDLYENVAWQLWKYGDSKLNSLTIKPSKGCRSIQNIEDISGLDWLTLASLRDSSNSVMAYDEVSDKVAGITLPSAIKEWFSKIGSQCIHDGTSLFFSSSLDELIKLNELYEKNYHVALFISGKIIDPFSQTKNTKDHWIILASKINVNGEPLSKMSSLNGKIKFNLFSWGRRRKTLDSTTLDEFLNHFYGGLVFTPIR